jgi:hypothetical protein
MRDRGPIAAGLVFFLALVTFPFWYNAAVGATGTPPELPRPEGEVNCVAPTDYMRMAHMDLLIDWREQVVRTGARSYVAFDGRTHIVSLTNTCLGCHAGQAEFCDKCHDYAGVKPPCQDCHLDPKALQRSVR